MSQDKGAKAKPLYTMGRFPVVWSRCRKAHLCANCGVRLDAGGSSFRPLTNGKGRDARWCHHCVYSLGGRVK